MSVPVGAGGGYRVSALAPGPGINGSIGGSGTARAATSVDPLYQAMFLFRRRDHDNVVLACDTILKKNSRDEAAWWLKCRALTEKAWIDDTEMEEEGVAEALMDDNAVAKAPRPGTSLARPMTGRPGNQALRPMSSAGRPVTGFARPGTASAGGGGGSVAAAFQGARPGTSRPVTHAGRLVRLGTASIMGTGDAGGPFIDLARLDLDKYAAHPALAKALADYLLYVEQQAMKVLDLAGLCIKKSSQGGSLASSWWWWARQGKAYYRLGLLRDAEQAFRSAIKEQDMLDCYLELGKIYQKIDQPKAAIEWYLRGSERHPGEPSLWLGAGRIHDALNDGDEAMAAYKRVLVLDNSNVEAVACLAADHFYRDQPEVALRYFRRLLQIGVRNTELWNNIGLCCFYAQQYDMALSCFERALALADDFGTADVWYNVSHVAIGIGDYPLAYQCLKLAVSFDPNHAEAYNNLGVLEVRKDAVDAARASFATATRSCEHLHEPHYNAAVIAYRLGDCASAFDSVRHALERYPDHTESCELERQLKEHFSFT